MREILFRGKKKVYNKWVYGWYCGKILNSDMSSTEESSQIIDANTLYWHTCEPESVGQFTGLTDTNGKKIFEGDILKRTNGNKYLWYVDFKISAFCANQTNCNYSCELGELLETIEVEVIGNIHDNPELLED